ncbi:CYTH and CHAD domain-containing protein [Psychrobacter frigidicola]|uniref:CYTH and CHAD domain-containing protein n=1 Tax=Psychrobacter frigidicola TaxID=45611 RepID=A0A5C7A762_9GAMM|nr:CYTH and CHAD domain-containing protein [Psychrobacter frigidicola]TXD98374.1 CYTH and CHAD domain-containing protein [Psychrobacter frigidicola]
MQEIELKFLVSQARLKGLMRQAKVKSSQDIHMAAHYFDTPKQALAQAGIGLRIRQEGDTWVQTIKAGGDGMAARLEHNTVLDTDHVQAMLDGNNLMPDLCLYKDTYIAPALADFKVKKLAKTLTRQYVTDIQRTTRMLENNSNSLEMAYDEGEIIHGNDDSQRQPIQEIEFELVSGELAFLFATAKIWCKRYKLCLSTVTKAEHGGLLVKGEDYSPAVKADLQQLNVNKDSSMPAFIRAAIHNCLLQILPNSSAIVAGSEANSHILQLRIGLRRLTVALDTFNKFSEQLNPEWQPILKQTAALLGDYYELAYLTSHIEPILVQHGAPSIDWTIEVEHKTIKPIDAVSDNDLQLALLELIEFTMNDPCTEAQSDILAIDKLSKILSKKYMKLLENVQIFNDKDDNGLEFSDLEPDSYTYKIRCLLEDLRYISEFAAPLYGKKKSKRWLKCLTKAQKSLSQYHEHIQYQQYYQQKAVTDTDALYGAGWFAASLKTDHKRCQKHLDRIQDSATFW